MQTYQERVGRYRILRHEELPEAHKAEYRLRGIDPDDCWGLIWSFDEITDAEKSLANCNDSKASFQTYKIVDNGETSFITRSMF
jgi:hypothetical protein